MDKLMMSQVNPHAIALGIRVHLWEIDLRFAHALPAGWVCIDDFARIRYGRRWSHLRQRAWRSPAPFPHHIGRR